MQLTSPAFQEGANIPAKFTCEGDNINPELNLSGSPFYAASLVLIVEDPDVPESVRRDRMWDHWIVFNIPPRTTRIPQNSQPLGTPGMNTEGDLNYQGPCPPDRRHRYFFKMYALDVQLSLPRGANKAEVQQAMEGHILDQAQLMGYYEKKVQ